jgi:hypothetical protein
MKKVIYFIVFCLVICAALTAQITPDWDINKPVNTAQQIYEVGISQPFATEQEAYTDAWRNAVQQFISSIAVRFQGQTDITLQSHGFASGIEDVYTFYLETSSFSANVPITGVREMARKIERINGRFIARILASMSAEDYNRAKQYVENEEAAMLAYNHFRQRNVFQAVANQRPSGYDDYYSWLRNNCVIISIADPNPNTLLEQLDQFTRKLYRNAFVFAQIINGRGARIIYNSGRYYDGILRALQELGLFTIHRESSHLTLSPVRANIIGDFRNAVNNMKDSSRFVITGLETIQTQSGETVNQNSIIINQFRTITPRQFNMQAVNYAIPAQFLSGFVDEDAIIRHVRNNINAFPARYLVILRSQTRLERGMPEFRIPPMIIASCNFTLYDIVTGETIQSETAQTDPGAFSPVNLEDSNVTEESRRALQFLFNPRTQLGLETIMRGVFEQL